MIIEKLTNHESLPALVRPEHGDTDLLGLAERERERIRRATVEHGAILFRGFSVESPAAFNQFCRLLTHELLPYTERSTPRSHVEGEVYTSTEYPPEATIPLHCEMAYTKTWPSYVWFYSQIAAETGGETPICDAMKVYELISPKTRERFADQGVLYVRNFRKGIDLPWQEVYGVSTESELEAYCSAHDIGFEWLEQGVLRTRARAQAVIRHPSKGQMVWFNQAHLFHVSNLEPTLRGFLLKRYTELGVPRNSFYGDGSAIEPEVLAEIRAAYAQAELAFPWEAGDVLMVDNMQVSHGRRPFTGERKTLVAMAEAFSQ